MNVLLINTETKKKKEKNVGTFFFFLNFELIKTWIRIRIRNTDPDPGVQFCLIFSLKSQILRDQLIGRIPALGIKIMEACVIPVFGRMISEALLTTVSCCSYINQNVVSDKLGQKSKRSRKWRREKLEGKKR